MWQGLRIGFLLLAVCCRRKRKLVEGSYLYRFVRGRRIAQDVSENPGGVWGAYG